MSSFIAELATVNSLQAEHDMISNIQQERKVTGRVFDADNKPIPGLLLSWKEPLREPLQIQKDIIVSPFPKVPRPCCFRSLE